MDVARRNGDRGCFACALTGLAFAAAMGGALADTAAPAFVPIPVIITDPNSGTTLGVLPTWLLEDEQGRIHRIIAPDIQHNTVFGWGAHARFLDYPSDDVQWSAVAGAFEHVQRKIELEYEGGRLRDARWSFSASLLYIRDGTPRYYGIGNDTPKTAESNYTSVQKLAQGQIGLNLTRTWQLLYTLRLQQVDVQPGTLHGIPSIQTLYGSEVLGPTRELLNRVAVVYDTRNDPCRTCRTSLSAFRRARCLLAAQLRGWRPQRSGGPAAAARVWRGALHRPQFVLSHVRAAAEAGLNRNLPHDVELEVAPFLELGKVFEHPGSSPISHLHPAVGLGIRGIARPFVVAYVDVGYGHEGAAVFTGINYPF